MRAMVPGPLFRVELVAAARQRRYYLLRVVYACIILFTLWVSYENMAYRTYANDGQTSIAQMAETAKAFFYSFSWVQLIGILAVGPAMAVGTIATERERRTIEYLFTTDLSNLEIVLGKTFARLLVVGKFVLVSLPILFLFRLLGGIPAEMVAASFLVAGSTALFVTAISVCVSVWSARARDAAMRVYRILFAILIMPIILTWMVFAFGAGPGFWSDLWEPVIGFLRDINPLWVFGTAMSGVFATGSGFQFDPVMRMVGYHAGLSIALVALATAAVRRVHLRESGASAKPKKKSQRDPRRSWLPRWRPELGDNGMLWKEAFAPTSKARLGMVAGAANIIIVLVVLGSIFYTFLLSVFGDNAYRGARQYFEFSGVFSGFIGGGVLLLLAARASGLVTIEKERDCWTSLLSTPLTGGEIMRGKMLGNLYSARWGALLLLINSGLGVFIDPTFAFAIAAQMLAFGLCAWFVTNLGLFFSLRSTTSLRAMGFTLGVGCFIGGGYLMCCCPLMAIGGGSGPGDEMMLGFAPCMPFLIVAPIAAFDMMSHDYADSMIGTMTMGYVVGVIGYAVASAVLMNYLALQFDQVAGRTGDVPGVSRAA